MASRTQQLGDRRRWARAVGVLVLALCGAALHGCGGEDAGATEPIAIPDHPTPGGTLIVATLADAARLDPHAVTDAASMRVIENLYSTLLCYGNDYGAFRGDLAQSVDVSDDQLTYTITLVDGAHFHSGRPVTADAVAFSIRRIIDQRIRADQFRAVERIDTPDGRTVVITLAHPVAPFRSYLAHPMNAIVDPAAVEAAGGSLDRTDAGSGPFKLVEWQRDRRVVLARHDGYHVSERPYLDRVIIRPIADETARTTALRTGEVHLITEVAPKDVAILEAAPGVVVGSTPGTFWEYIGLNCAAPPFDDPRVRRAVAHAVDRDQLNRLVKFGQATPLTGGHLPPNHWAHADLDLYPTRDLDRARTLIAESGNATPIPVELIVDSSVTYQVRAAEAIKQQLKPAGLDVRIQALESAAFFDRLGRGDFQMTVVGWMGFVDPDEWTWNLFHSDGRYNQQNYANADVDALLDRGRRTLDRADRRAIYADAQRIIARDAPMVFLYVNDQTSAWRERVVGYRVHPTATTRALADVWLAPAR